MSTVKTGPRPDDAPVGPGRGRLTAVAVTVAVLLAGGGTFAAVGNGGKPDGGKPDAAAPGDPVPLVLDAYPAPESTDRAPAYRAEGDLPAGPDRAAVYRPGGGADEETVTALARALGITAQPRQQDGSWVAADGTDGMGPALRVAAADGAAWSFVHYTAEGDDLGGLPKGEREPAARTPPFDGDARPGSAPAAPITPPVTAEEAEEVAAPVLAAAGVAGSVTDARETTGSLRTVGVDPAVRDLPTRGWRTTVTVGADGRVVRAAGHLGAAEPLATYPVMDAAETLRVMSARGVPTTVHCVTAPCPPQPVGPAPGEEEVVVTDATFGLSAQPSQGRTVLVPSWLFRLGEGGGDGHTLAFPALEPADVTAGRAAPVDPGAPGSPDDSTAAPAEPGPGDPQPADPPRAGLAVDAYGASDRELTVHFTGGVCGTYSGVARETGDEVRVTVTEEPDGSGQPCILLAQEMSVEVELDGPVGDRRVVDAEGDPVPRR
ncbi:hypothetical protein [Streptomyces sp. GSL17-111]|uniref:hypothetical protein n=1 Tax=Streptomyces sp. GSL17-111 TaxID=3121596 RepID=UPI0030F3E83F